jgi:hypothetical protein
MSALGEGGLLNAIRPLLHPRMSEMGRGIQAHGQTGSARYAGAPGLREIGSGDLDAQGAETPGAAVGLATMIATHNSAGFIVSTGMKAYEEESGNDTVEGRARQIADVLRQKFQQQGWI